MHFAPERVSLTPVPVDIGGFKAYGLSANGEYATVDENRLGYVSVPEGSIAEPTVRTNVQLPTHYLIEHFSGAMGLQSEDLILMSYRSGHGIQVNTSNGPMVLTYDACQPSFTNVNFCAELEPHGTLVINAQRVGLSQELSIRADGKLVFVGQWLLDTDEVPMKISVSKSLDKHLDGLLDLMPKMIEASYEYFWSRGQALSWDPVRQRMTLSYGEWTTSYSGPTPPDVIFTPC
ncbi:hypothetical protein FOL47_000375 [Perkinsus chesapeaki]|uniref:Uncharacterized protein n=1 Tax=Perkinsus chesapeaki TaxID=330153 RepID=A0A7J6KX16_PERCH|nr:hypothetical protein FOL47_000375 [Perkinsus chesapeaki]